MTILHNNLYLTLTTRMRYLRFGTFFAGLFAALTAIAYAVTPSDPPQPLPKGTDYYLVRDGLENCRIKFMREKKARVVFMGGSITAMNGWCLGVQADLKSRFPETTFEFINVGIPSLGSTPHSFRFQRDAMKNGPADLLFIEAAVNDFVNGMTPVETLRGMEGVVRQARLANPEMDIVMLHFIDGGLMKDIIEGKVPVVIQRHESVADYYGVPSIDLAREVTDRIQAGQFSWADDFKGTHPSAFGHAIYSRAITRLFDAIWNKPLAADAKIKTCKLPEKPLDEKSYFGGKLVPVESATLGEGWKIDPDWTPIDPPEKKIGSYKGFVHVPTLVAETPGATLRLSFEGTGVGIFVPAGPDIGIVEYSIDGGLFVEKDLWSGWSASIHLPIAYMLNADLAPGKHEMVLRVSGKSNPKSKGTTVRIVQ